MAYPIYTIGHSSLPIERFISLLQTHGVSAVADIRSSPHSARFPQYNRKELRKSLEDAGIRYVFLGTELGARRKEPEAHEGQIATYNRIAQLPLFRQGIRRILEGIGKMSLALMCAEKDPLECHRTILVCRNLPQEVRTKVLHIVEGGRIESQSEAEARLLSESGIDSAQDDMFGNVEKPIDRAYRKRGQEIAWQENEPTDETVHDRVHKKVG